MYLCWRCRCSGMEVVRRWRRNTVRRQRTECAGCSLLSSSWMQQRWETGWWGGEMCWTGSDRAPSDGQTTASSCYSHVQYCGRKRQMYKTKKTTSGRFVFTQRESIITTQGGKLHQFRSLIGFILPLIVFCYIPKTTMNMQPKYVSPTFQLCGYSCILPVYRLVN